MTFVLAGFLAAGLSWLLNGALVDRGGRWWIIAIGPGFEELFKTGAALFFGASIFYSHIVFGAVEALRDLVAGRPSGIPAGLASLAGHGLFGFLAGLVYTQSRSILLAVILPTGVHLLWNGGVLLARRRLTG